MLLTAIYIKNLIYIENIMRESVFSKITYYSNERDHKLYDDMEQNKYSDFAFDFESDLCCISKDTRRETRLLKMESLFNALYYNNFKKAIYFFCTEKIKFLNKFQSVYSSYIRDNDIKEFNKEKFIYSRLC